mgnify:CR=1 FL=1
MANWFDTHIHLSAPERLQAPEELYHQAQSAGITDMLMPGVRVADWPRLLGLAQSLTGVYLAPGLHPAYAENTGTVLLEAAVAGVPVITTSASPAARAATPCRSRSRSPS